MCAVCKIYCAATSTGLRGRARAQLRGNIAPDPSDSNPLPPCCSVTAEVGSRLKQTLPARATEASHERGRGAEDGEWGGRAGPGLLLGVRGRSRCAGVPVLGCERDRCQHGVQLFILRPQGYLPGRGRQGSKGESLLSSSTQLPLEHSY